MGLNPVANVTIGVVLALGRPGQLRLLAKWPKSYRPWERFDAQGTLISDLQQLSPMETRGMGFNRYTHRGLSRALRWPGSA